MAKSDKRKPDELPAWAQHLKQTYKNSISACFILHGSGITDYVDNWNVNLHGVLNEALQDFPIVVHYALSNGVTFPFEDRTDAAGNTVSISPSESMFVERVAPDRSSGASIADVLAPFRAPGIAVAKFDQLLQQQLVEKNDAGKIIKRDRLIAVVIHMAEYIVPDGNLGAMPIDMRQLIATLERWGRDAGILSKGNLVVLTTRSLTDLHQRLRLAGSKYEAIELGIPTEADRRTYISYIQKSDPLPYEPGLNNEVFTKLTAGLSRVGIEDIKYSVSPGDKLTRTLVTKRKEDLISLEYGDVITMLDPRRGYESVGGYDEIKDAFMKRIVRQMRNGEPPDWSGVMLVGPGGTGKTIFAEATAYEIGIPAVSFNLDKMKSKYVGESGKNLDKAIHLLREMAPVVCWIDEIDGALPNRNDANQDSGVSAGMLSRVLPFISDPEVRERIVFIAATNRSDKVDSALKRVGRFDRIVPMVAPTARDRRALLQNVYLKDQGIAWDSPLRPDPSNHPSTLLTRLVEGTETWTGAEIRNLVNKAREIATDTGDDLSHALIAALDRIRPNTADIRGLTAIALLECNDLDLLPEEHRKKLETFDGRKKFVEEAVEYARDAAASGVVRVRRDN